MDDRSETGLLQIESWRAREYEAEVTWGSDERLQATMEYLPGGKVLLVGGHFGYFRKVSRLHRNLLAYFERPICTLSCTVEYCDRVREFEFDHA